MNARWVVVTLTTLSGSWALSCADDQNDEPQACAGASSEFGGAPSSGGSSALGGSAAGGSPAASGGAAAAGFLKVCERPESAYFDDISMAWYVSCQSKADVADDGYIAKLSADGTVVVTEKFVQNLDEPKGIGVHDGKLYVSDVKELVTASIADGQVLSTTAVAGIDADVPAMPFLNDVAVHAATGDVYVSDNRNNALFRFDKDGKNPALLSRSPQLEAPNGLLVDDRDAQKPRLLIAAMGPGLNPARAVTDKLGAVLGVTLADLNDGDEDVEVTFLSPRVGNLDGLAWDGNDLIVSDFFAGRVMRLPAQTVENGPEFGDAKILRQTLLRAADLGIDAARKFAVVPESNNGAVVFLDLSML